MKRVFDLSVALVATVLLFPFLLLVSVLIWILMGRPIFFWQQRVGLNGCLFWMVKFRTMTVLRGAEKGRFEPGKTSRITGLGRLMRRTKVDELPQFWNVLRGDMSLVGPRPEVPEWVAVYAEEWSVVHTIRPGITDPASICFRNEESILAQSQNPERTYRDEILPRKLQIYREYLQSRTFSGDLAIILRTATALFRYREAPMSCGLPNEKTLS